MLFACFFEPKVEKCGKVRKSENHAKSPKSSNLTSENIDRGRLGPKGCEKCGKVRKVRKSWILTKKHVKTLYNFPTWSNVPKMMVFAKFSKNIFREKCTFSESLCTSNESNGLGGHFRTFRTFAKKCEKSFLFGPSRKVVRNVVVLATF